MLPKAAVRGQHFQAGGHSFSLLMRTDPKPPFLPGNVSEAEEDSCSLDLDEGIHISSNCSSWLGSQANSVR